MALARFVWCFFEENVLSQHFGFNSFDNVPGLV